MSELVVFLVGVIVFAITVYGSIMAAGISLTRRVIDENPEFSTARIRDELTKTVPTDIKY